MEDVSVGHSRLAESCCSCSESVRFSSNSYPRRIGAEMGASMPIVTELSRSFRIVMRIVPAITICWSARRLSTSIFSSLEIVVGNISGLEQEQARVIVDQGVTLMLKMLQTPFAEWPYIRVHGERDTIFPRPAHECRTILMCQPPTARTLGKLRLETGQAEGTARNQTHRWGIIFRALR